MNHRVAVTAALVTVGALALAASGPASKKPPPPDAGVNPYACPPTGCPGGCTVGDTQACTLGNGCSGIQTCRAGTGTFGPCTCAHDSVLSNPSATCTGCGGASGHPTACDSSCNVRCNVGAEQCNNCDDDGDGVIDNAPGQGAGSLKQACNPLSCTDAGTQTCSAGVWSGCTGCGGLTGLGTCSTQCASPGQQTCLSSCTGTGACLGPEVCNNCDDNGDNRIDEGLSCEPCNL